MPEAVQTLTLNLARGATKTVVLTAFFAGLALDISVPAIVLLGLAAIREIGVGMADSRVASGHTFAGQSFAGQSFAGERTA